MKLSMTQRELVSRLYAEHFFMLLCYAESVLRREDAAEEAVQETFRIACVRISRLERSGNPGGWLMNVLKNVLRNRRRILRRFRNVFSPLPLEETSPAAPDQTSELDMSIAAILTPEEYRLYRRVIAEEEPVAAAASALGISPDACRKRVQRVREKLRAAFGQAAEKGKGGEDHG